MSNGIYQNSVFGLAAKLPGKYTGGIILGNNISGLFVSIVSLISAVVSSSTRMAAIYYFITALFVLFVGVDTIFALPLNVSIIYKLSAVTIYDHLITKQEATIQKLFSLFFTFFLQLLNAKSILLMYFFLLMLVGVPSKGYFFSCYLPN